MGTDPKYKYTFNLNSMNYTFLFKLPLIDQTLALNQTMPDKFMCLSTSLYFFVFFCLCIWGFKNQMACEFICAQSCSIFLSFSFRIFLSLSLLLHLLLSLLSWPQEPTGVWVSVLIGDQAVFHKEVFTDGYVCLYVSLCLSVWGRYLHVCLGLCLHVCVLSFIFALEGWGTNWRVSEWAVS